MQPAEVGPGQPLDYAVTGFGQSDANHAAVVAIRYPLDQPGRLSPVDELHRAMRPQQQVAGEVAHGRRLLFRVSLYRHQQLVLYMGKGRRFSLVLAPALEFAQSDPEFQQSLEIPPGHPRHRHLHNLSSMPRTAGNFRQHARGRCRKCLRHSIGSQVRWSCGHCPHTCTLPPGLLDAGTSRPPSARWRRSATARQRAESGPDRGYGASSPPTWPPGRARRPGIKPAASVPVAEVISAYDINMRSVSASGGDDRYEALQIPGPGHHMRRG